MYICVYIKHLFILFLLKERILYKISICILIHLKFVNTEWELIVGEV